MVSLAERYGAAIPGLSDELKQSIEKSAIPESAEAKLFRTVMDPRAADPAAELPKPPMEDEVNERIVATTVGARPVARIRNNQVTADFIGPSSKSWKDAIEANKAVLDKAVPAVGRIELNNSDYPWAGTGWMIEPGIIVTNRHVAQIFAKVDRRSAHFVFKSGLSGGSVSADIDFLEEENRLDEAEHPITSVMWIATNDEADVAFLKVDKASGLRLPDPIEITDTVTEGQVIAAIGYPARDPSIRDQELVISIFGPDVYEKKRFAPGMVMSVDGHRIRHDCSTLGGNSGSVLLELSSGRAIGLHHGGYLDDSANLAVTATYVRELLARASRDGARRPTAKPSQRPEERAAPAALSGAEGIRMKFFVPIEIVVNVGMPVQDPRAIQGMAVPIAAGHARSGLDAAVEAARAQIGSNPDVVRIRAGYRFKNGWITDERVVVIEVREKLDYGELMRSGAAALPREIMGIGVDVRSAALPDQLDALGVDLTVAEKIAKPAGYTEPPGYNDESSEMYLGLVREKMSAVFHVSPDAGFVNLKTFLGRVEKSLTATIYEWEVNHISDALEAAMKPAGRSLRMVTQKRGVAEKEATEEAVADMKRRIGRKFKHVWASTRGPQRLIPDSYHIKVASRDGKEFWLSSGNWKSSNQPENPNKATALTKFNREWHAIVTNERLATLFQKYIEYDFKQATDFPLEEREAPAMLDIEFFVPEEAFGLGLERVPGVTYDDRLVVENEELSIQPLLTPDQDRQGRRMFLRAATDMVKRATKSLYIQNQSFSFTAENNDEFGAFFEAVKQKQHSIDDVRIIFRDAREYGRAKDLERQQEIIERLKDDGFDVSPNAMRLQLKCHTKGIIIDGKEVLLGSQNLTNGGSLFNRDASLLVRSEKVARFFEKIFLYDWDNLAHNEADESVGGIRRAAPGEATPPGFRRVKLSELLGDD